MRIIGLGSYLPENIVTNKSLEKNVNTNDEWVFSRLGIRERRICNPEQSSSDLGFMAAKNALDSCNKTIHDIDLIIVATSTPDRKSPSTACIIQEKFDRTEIPAFDLNAVCSGFIYALGVSNSLLKSGAYNRILLIAAEKYSSITDWSDRNCVFFGDGAGAVILEKDDDNLFDCVLKSDGKGKDGFSVIPETGFFKMDGRAVFNQGTKVLPSSIAELLNRTNLTVDDINLCVPHQPSVRILKSTANTIGLPINKVAMTMHKYANTAGASIPVTLVDAFNCNKLQYDDIILFTAVGSGWTWGSAIIRWKL